MRSIVYHKFRKELHIINGATDCISSLRMLFMHATRDDIQPHGWWDTSGSAAWWYTIAFAMDKNKTVRRLSYFGTLKGIRTPDPLLRRQMLYPTELSAHVERVMGIEPTRPAWKAGILPLNYTRSSTTQVILT